MQSIEQAEYMYNHVSTVFKQAKADGWSLQYACGLAGISYTQLYRLADREKRYRDLIKVYRGDEKLSMSKDLDRIVVLGLRDCLDTNMAGLARRLKITKYRASNYSCGTSKMPLDVFLNLLKLTDENLHDHIVAKALKHIKHFKIEE